MSRSLDSVAETIRVVYSGSLQIPICIGSIAIPLRDSERGLDAAGSAQSPLPRESGASTSEAHRRDAKRVKGEKAVPTTAAAAPSIIGNRYTHKRYCYIRDGSALSEDCFYRWLSHHTRNTAKQMHRDRNLAGCEQESADANTSAVHNARRKRRRAAEEGGGSDGEASGELSASSSALLSEDELTPKSPSLLYSFIDHVEFVVPSSFAKPRRVVRHPPFLIEDHTWAEHLVEVKIYFLPALAIPPTTLMHQVLLQRRVVGLPLGLLGRHQGLPKPTPMVLLPAAAHTAKGSCGAPLDEESWRSTCAAIVPSERQDSLRLLHPSLPVVAHYRRVLAKQTHPLLQRLREHFYEHVYGESDAAVPPSQPRPAAAVAAAHEPTLPHQELPMMYQASLSSPQAPELGFLLPAEACLFDHTQRRREQCLSTLDAALTALGEEQKELSEGIVEALAAVHAQGVALKGRLDDLHGVCLQKLGSGT